MACYGGSFTLLFYIRYNSEIKIICPVSLNIPHKDVSKAANFSEVYSVSPMSHCYEIICSVTASVTLVLH
jgi:hypothetical protein